MSRGLPSLEIVAGVARSERDKQMSHFDALDAKAGVLVGFAGVLVALLQGLAPAVTVAAAVLASCSGLTAVVSFWPRALPVLDVAHLRRYIAAEPAFTELSLLDTMSEMLDEGAVLLARKGRTLKTAMALLGAALAVVAVGVVMRSLG